MRFARVLTIIGVAASLWVGCGDSDTTETGKTQRPWTYQSLQVNLPGKAGPEDAGFLLAHRLGYFPQAKIGVYFITPSHAARPPMYVDEELVDAAIIHEPQLLLSRQDGRPLVAFGSLVPNPTMAMIWLKGSGVENVADLKGKTIAIPGVRFQRFFLEAVLDRAGLTLADVKLESVSYHLEAELVHGRADAIFGGSMNTEGKLLEARGLDPVATPVTKLGIPDYDELVLVARRDRYRENPELFQRLLRSTVRGNASVAGHPGAATKAIVHQAEYENSSRPNAPVHAKATRAGVEEMAPRLSRGGEVDRAKLKRLIDWMYEQGMLERKVPVTSVLAEP